MIAARDTQHQTADNILAALARQGVRLDALTADSRKVTPGCGFAAYPGESGDGRAHLAQAIAAGAAAVLWEQLGYAWPQQWAELPNVPVAGLKDRIGEIAAAVYGNPSEKLWVIGVTGTNGKTSCAHWLAQSLTGSGKRSAVIGTLGNGFPDALTASVNTTPDAIVLQQALADYVTQGARVAVMEVSSHGLAQGRVNGVQFDVAVLTNLSRDHLDYHGDMAGYAAAKATLFQWPGLRYAVLNIDDEFGRALADQLRASQVEVMSYGMHNGSRVHGTALKLSAVGLEMDVESEWGNAHLASPLLGGFNAYNLLATLATLLVSGVPLVDAVRQLAAIKPVAGRMQALGGAGKPVVVVDYAHTPDALEKVLCALREMNLHGKLICVFGCGGNRDAGKRPLMGAIAARLADRVLVTSDNPRNEDPLAIIADITAGMSGDYRIDADRGAAISAAVQSAGAGDVVLVAGKGHEDYQEIRGVKYPFSDVAVATQALEAWTCA
ncbi:MAG TPA: UDP-N-acetylmuramoyl-L-alanyl-D-glutamate--2,6-diaminopimelate ligase [Sulfuriferula sp.]|nr:UDP-N-acetylmuramoyl-L-alanyl-D-glutamate--2,6-diaminopimelate ligase [Sulfuriferula sp.]